MVEHHDRGGIDVGCIKLVYGAWVGGHVWGLGTGHLVMRYTIKIRNVEKTTFLNSKVRKL